jgi:hypothetical protein
MITILCFHLENQALFDLFFELHRKLSLHFCGYSPGVPKKYLEYTAKHLLHFLGCYIYSLKTG